MKSLLIECGVAETRAALEIDETPRSFWFGPARGDERLPRSADQGDVFAGRVRKVARGLKGAFVDIGENRDAFLQFSQEGAAPVEGAAIIARVKRPAIGEKGAILSLRWREGLSSSEIEQFGKEAKDAAPQRLSSGRDAVLMARRFFGEVEHIRVETADIAAALASPESSIEIRMDRDASQRLEERIEQCLERSVALDGGARLIFDEAEGLTVVDVDAAHAVESGGASVNARVNARAAEALFKELSVRAIGGRVVVDFLPFADAAAAKAFARTLQSFSGGYPCRFGGLRSDGLFDLTAPRTRLSLLEQASEPDGAALRPGRRLTLDWSAKAALWKLETWLKHRPKARPRLLVGAEIAAYLEGGRPQWRERLSFRYGPRFSISASDRLNGRGFDLCE